MVAAPSGLQRRGGGGLAAAIARALGDARTQAVVAEGEVERVELKELLARGAAARGGLERRDRRRASPEPLQLAHGGAHAHEALNANDGRL